MKWKLEKVQEVPLVTGHGPDCKEYTQLAHDIHDAMLTGGVLKITGFKNKRESRLVLAALKHRSVMSDCNVYARKNQLFITLKADYKPKCDDE